MIIIESPVFLYSLSALVGLAVGSFLNVVIYRLPKMIERDWQMQCAEYNGTTTAEPTRFNLAFPSSSCPRCGHVISAIENIPVLSYLGLRGKCRVCREPIGLRYPLIETLSGLAALAGIAQFGFTVAGVSAVVFLWSLIALTAIDFDTQLLPDAITLPLIWAGLLVNIGAAHVDLTSSVIGAVAGYMLLWSVYWLFKLATGKEGMGFGDFKLLAAIGAWLGWQMLPLVILFSSFVGAVVGLALIAFRRQGKDIPIPFGPYLAAAGAIALFWGDTIMAIYLSA
jgi:leader peptidase (prepilin peptidase)/N-methyltransferase